MNAEITARAPATLSNLGPGFDSLGAALTGWEDEVRILLTPAPPYSVEYDVDGVWSGTVEPNENTASLAAMEVGKVLGYTGGARITIKKGIRAGSGLGSSAASAVAGAVAMNAALGCRLSTQELIVPSLIGESAASGANHGDNVLPCLLGGVVVLESGDPMHHAHVVVGNRLHIAVIFPDIQVLTMQARGILPEFVSMTDTTAWASRLGLLINAFNQGDIEQIGRLIMSDRIVEPRRATLLEPYQNIKNRALLNGAMGCALSGSGPSMFAICDSESVAQTVCVGMKETCERDGISGTVQVVEINLKGAYIV